MNKNSSIYTDIATRTNGDVYIGVVGPVRCGKSTLIQKFIQNFVLDNISNKHDRDRTIDELPQASDGTMVMTTKPQFVPNEAVKVKIGNAEMSVRLIDSVGFMVDGAEGAEINDKPRLVKTPWSENEIPFVQAALIGTEKVIKEHSTIAVAVTTDGSFGDISRESFIDAENKTIRQLKETKKPFVVVLNSANPNDKKAKQIVEDIKAKHNVKVVATNINELKKKEDMVLDYGLSSLTDHKPNKKFEQSFKSPIKDNRAAKEYYPKKSAEKKSEDRHYKKHPVDSGDYESPWA
jgi:stage IV sporulation protein A